MQQQDEEFYRLLTAARLDAFELAAWLQQRGFTGVRILPASTTPNRAQRFQHVDAGDIEITQRIETKHRPDLDFQSLDDFPYADIIVDEAYKIAQRPLCTLYGYIIQNASKTGCVFISSRTAHRWRKELLNDKRQGPREFMLCPKSCARFYRLQA